MWERWPFGKREDPRKPADSFSLVVDQLLSKESLTLDEAHIGLGKFVIYGILTEELNRWDSLRERTVPTKFEDALERLTGILGEMSDGNYIGAKAEAEKNVGPLIDAKYGEVGERDMKFSRVLRRLANLAPDTGRPIMDLLDPRKDAKMIAELKKRGEKASA